MLPGSIFYSDFLSFTDSPFSVPGSRPACRGAFSQHVPAELCSTSGRRECNIIHGWREVQETFGWKSHNVWIGKPPVLGKTPDSGCSEIEHMLVQLPHLWRVWGHRWGQGCHPAGVHVSHMWASKWLLSWGGGWGDGALAVEKMGGWSMCVAQNTASWVRASGGRPGLGRALPPRDTVPVLGSSRRHVLSIRWRLLETGWPQRCWEYSCLAELLLCVLWLLTLPTGNTLLPLNPPHAGCIIRCCIQSHAQHIPQTYRRGAEHWVSCSSQ